MPKGGWGRFLIYMAIYGALLLGTLWGEVQARTGELPPPSPAGEQEKPGQPAAPPPVPQKPAGQGARQVQSWHFPHTKDPLRQRQRGQLLHRVRRLIWGVNAG